MKHVLMFIAIQLALLLTSSIPEVISQEYVTVKFYQLSSDKWRDGKATLFQQFVSDNLPTYCTSEATNCGISNFSSSITIPSSDVQFNDDALVEDSYGVSINSRVTYDGSFVSNTVFKTFLATNRHGLSDEIGHEILSIDSNLYSPRPPTTTNIIVCVTASILLLLLIVILCLCIYFGDKRVYRHKLQQMDEEKLEKLSERQKDRLHRVARKNIYGNAESTKLRSVPPPADPNKSSDNALPQEIISVPLQGLNFFHESNEDNNKHTLVAHNSWKESDLLTPHGTNEVPKEIEEPFDDETEIQQIKKSKKEKKKKKKSKPHENEKPGPSEV